MNPLIIIAAWLVGRIPAAFQLRLYEIALKHLPLPLLRRIPCSYATYLECYRPGKGDVVLDCGAHIGNCAILFSRLVGKEGLVIAAEPLENTFQVLQQRVHRLGLGNVLTVKKGVWNRSTQQALRVTESTLANRLVPREEAENNTAPTDTVDCVTIDDLVDGLKIKRLDYIKMDIEGAEIEALEGSQNTIKNFMPNFAIASYHKRDGRKTAHRLEGFLSERGYEVRTFFPSHLTTCARRPSNTT